MAWQHYLISMSDDPLPCKRSTRTCCAFTISGLGCASLYEWRFNIVCNCLPTLLHEQDVDMYTSTICLRKHRLKFDCGNDEHQSWGESQLQVTEAHCWNPSLILPPSPAADHALSLETFVFGSVVACLLQWQQATLWWKSCDGTSENFWQKLIDALCQIPASNLQHKCRGYGPGWHWQAN